MKFEISDAFILQGALMTLPSQSELEAMPLAELYRLQRQAARKVLFLSGKNQGVSFHVQAVAWDALWHKVSAEIQTRSQKGK